MGGSSAFFYDMTTNISLFGGSVYVRKKTDLDFLGCIYERWTFKQNARLVFVKSNNDGRLLVFGSLNDSTVMTSRKLQSRKDFLFCDYLFLFALILFHSLISDKCNL